MSIAQANEKEIQEFLTKNTAWDLKDNKLHREYQFKDFVEAFDFMTQVASFSELSDHHPEWCNIYNKVVVDLTTHEVGSITERDFSLAKQMNKIHNNIK